MNFLLLIYVYFTKPNQTLKYVFKNQIIQEESIKRRLLEVKQMRENPEFFKLENTRGFKFTNISSQEKIFIRYITFGEKHNLVLKAL